MVAGDPAPTDQVRRASRTELGEANEDENEKPAPPGLSALR
tara:strand:+ start:2247 stop:2369 length:123 start_codon:yes stop_codon:yes gene_type:complete